MFRALSTAVGMAILTGAIFACVYIGSTSTGYLMDAAGAPAAAAGQWISESIVVAILLDVISIPVAAIHGWLLVPMVNWLSGYEYGRVFLDQATISMTFEEAGLIAQLFALLIGSVAIGTVVFMAICRTFEQLTQ